MVGRFVALLFVIISMVTFFLVFTCFHSSIFQLKYKIVIEILYTISLLTLIGWVIWWQIVENYSNDIKNSYVLWSVLFITVHILCLTFHVVDAMKGSLREWQEPPIQDLILLSIIMIGVPFLYKTYWFDTIWVFLLVICQHIQHEVLQSINSFSIFIINSVHLIVASIWASGLTFLLIYWKRQKEYIQSFLPIFSEYTFFCMTVLTVTGSIRASFYFTSFHHYFSHWGLLFLLKLLIVCMIVFVSSVIRTKMKQGTSKYWIMTNYLLLVMITIIVAILKQMNE